MNVISFIIHSQKHCAELSSMSNNFLFNKIIFLICLIICICSSSSCCAECSRPVLVPHGSAGGVLAGTNDSSRCPAAQPVSNSPRREVSSSHNSYSPYYINNDLVCDMKYTNIFIYYSDYFRFKVLPFYEQLAEILKPSSLQQNIPQTPIPSGQQNTPRQKEAEFAFHMTPAQVQPIVLSN